MSPDFPRNTSEGFLWSGLAGFDCPILCKLAGEDHGIGFDVSTDKPGFYRRKMTKEFDRKVMPADWVCPSR